MLFFCRIFSCRKYNQKIFFITKLFSNKIVGKKIKLLYIVQNFNREKFLKEKQAHPMCSKGCEMKFISHRENGKQCCSSYVTRFERVTAIYLSLVNSHLSYYSHVSTKQTTSFYEKKNEQDQNRLNVLAIFTFVSGEAFIIFGSLFRQVHIIPI